MMSWTKITQNLIWTSSRPSAHSSATPASDPAAATIRYGRRCCLCYCCCTPAPAASVPLLLLLPPPLLLPLPPPLPLAPSCSGSFFCRHCCYYCITATPPPAAAGGDRPGGSAHCIPPYPQLTTSPCCPITHHPTSPLPRLLPPQHGPLLSQADCPPQLLNVWPEGLDDVMGQSKEWPQGIVKSCVEDHFDAAQNNAFRPLIRNSCR